MSGYYRISKLKSCVSSLKNLKNIKKFSNDLGTEINDVCLKLKGSQDATGVVSKIKEVNDVLTKEIDVVAGKLKGSSQKLLNQSELVKTCKTKLEDGCKPLYTLHSSIEEKRTQYKQKYVQSKHIKKEVKKLCEHLIKRRVYGNTVAWTAAGLVSKEGGQATASAAEASNAVIDPIPEPPPIPDIVEPLNQLNALGEPTFASLGLGGWTPVGIVQNCMEYLHVTLGIEWWAAIALATLIIRMCMFPLVVISQRNAAKMNNYMPQVQLLQLKMTEARQTGDAIGAARYSQELMQFMQEKGLNPFKNMIVPFVQMPVFVSFFMGLREMANVPVESLRHGGLFWFSDLTLPDQYFLLPIITSTTLWLTIELGTDAAKLSSQNAVIMKYVLRALPVVILPFTVNFPGVILCYWVASNFISLAQVAFLRTPKVRDYFKIEPMIKFTEEQLPVQKKGFREGIKDSWTNIKITRELEERRRLDEIQFQKAGKGPVQKTFKYDPTKKSSPGAQAPISAKKR